MPADTSQHNTSEQPAVDNPGLVGWPSLVALLTIALTYLLLTENRTFGPTWLPPAVVGLTIVAALLAERQSAHHMRRWFVLGANAVITAALVAGTGLLIYGLSTLDDNPIALLRDALLLWTLNIMAFALWFWELDNGGPLSRSRSHYRSIDFAFPQKQLDPEGAWTPAYLDYLFLAFNTNTAFSPTDTLILSRLAKLCMMVQSSIALIDVAVIVARAVSALQN